MSKQYTNCYIAFLDILGFKELIKTRTCDELCEIFTTKMKKHIGAVYKGTDEILSMDNVKVKVMSDSICFFIDSSVRNALFGLTITCATFQNELMKMSPPILCRGAIVKGDLFWDGDVIFGSGFVDAYLMEEKNAKFPRIIMTMETIQSAQKNTADVIMNDLRSLTFVDYDDFLVIDNIEKFEGFDIDGTNYENLYNHIVDVLEQTVDDSVREKYLYLKNSLLRWYKLGGPQQCQNNQQQ